MDVGKFQIKISDQNFRIPIKLRLIKKKFGKLNFRKFWLMRERMYLFPGSFSFPPFSTCMISSWCDRYYSPCTRLLCDSSVIKQSFEQDSRQRLLLIKLPEFFKWTHWHPWIQQKSTFLHRQSFFLLSRIVNCRVKRI